MAILCPACNKAAQTSAACQRCGCDLSRLHEIEDAAAARLQAAAAPLASRDLIGASAAAERSWQLRHTPAAARMAFLAASARGDTAQAVRWRARAYVARATAAGGDSDSRSN